MPYPRPAARPRLRATTSRLVSAASVAFVLTLVAGCVHGPSFVSPAQRVVIDRGLVDYPGGVEMEEVVRGLTGPCDFDIERHGNLVIAESGAGGQEPRIFGYKPDGTYFNIYPAPRTVRVPFDIIKTGFVIYGPLGGIAAVNDKIFVAH